MAKKIYKCGDIVALFGIKLRVLENYRGKDGHGEDLLFVQTVEPQGYSTFGETNNYRESVLRERVDEWLEQKILAHGVNKALIQFRDVSLRTVDGRANFGMLPVKAAPLTLDEARTHAKYVIPYPDGGDWMATGWEGGKDGDGVLALFQNPTGGIGLNSVNGTNCFRPALLISSLLFDGQGGASEETGSDLSKYTTDELLGEIRRRTRTERDRGHGN